MELRVLGPLEVSIGEHRVPLGGFRQRLVLGVLLLHANRSLSADWLVDAVWGEDPPRTARKTLQAYVSRLRSALGSELIEASEGGYQIRFSPFDLDSARFEQLAEEGHQLLGTDAVAGCSGSRPLTFDLAHPMEPPAQPFQISGEAVDDGGVCAVGMWTDELMQTMEGADLDIGGWIGIFEAAVETRSAAEATTTKTFECGDGSGTITINEHTLIDFAVLDPADYGAGITDGGTWTIEGTGDYASLTGSGRVTTVWDEMQIHFVGEIEV